MPCFDLTSHYISTSSVLPSRLFVVEVGSVHLFRIFRPSLSASSRKWRSNTFNRSVVRWCSVVSVCGPVELPCCPREKCCEPTMEIMDSVDFRFSPKMSVGFVFCFFGLKPKTKAKPNRTVLGQFLGRFFNETS